jgi:uncharacterized protein YpbB
MKKILFIAHVILLISIASTSARSQEVSQKQEVSVDKKIVQQIKRVSDKAKKIETSTRELLIALRKLVEKKKNDSNDFLSREIK